MKLLTLPALLVLASAAFAADDEKDFKPLFNGKDLTGWHVRKADSHNGWKVEDGILKNDLKKGEHGVDLITDGKFFNFTVRYEYQVPDGSNSGFYLRGRHEIQILGDFASGKVAKGGNGAIYNHKEPSEFASKPASEWQTVEATMIGDKITVILNGKKIHDNVACDRATGSQLDNNVKEPGPFFLQGDHGTVSFRNIRVKELPSENSGK
jgi:hypothetical protein